MLRHFGITLCYNLNMRGATLVLLFLCGLMTVHADFEEQILPRPEYLPPPFVTCEFTDMYVDGRGFFCDLRLITSDDNVTFVLKNQPGLTDNDFVNSAPEDFLAYHTEGPHSVEQYAELIHPQTPDRFTSFCASCHFSIRKHIEGCEVGSSLQVWEIYGDEYRFADDYDYTPDFEEDSRVFWRNLTYDVNNLIYRAVAGANTGDDECVRIFKTTVTETYCSGYAVPMDERPIRNTASTHANLGGDSTDSLVTDSSSRFTVELAVVVASLVVCVGLIRSLTQMNIAY